MHLSDVCLSVRLFVRRLSQQQTLLLWPGR